MEAKDEVVQAAVSLEGRIAAEHGIGCVKVHNLHWNIDEPTLRMMRSFKKLLDPKGILNPGKVMPKELSRASRTCSVNSSRPSARASGNLHPCPARYSARREFP